MTEQDRLTPEGLIHPTRSEQFMAGASGITVITEELNEFNKARRPHHVARPGIDSERFRPDLVPPLARASLGIGDRTSSCSSTTAPSTTRTSTRC